MSLKTYFLYLAVMAGSTYLIRSIPFVAIQKKIENRFIRSFLTYIPYAVLTAMTIPAIFYAPSRVEAAAVGLLVAILLSLKNRGLLLVAVCASAAVFVTEWGLCLF